MASDTSQEKHDNEIQEELEIKKDTSPLDSGFPLIKEFREIAPGSHKHSQTLAGMIENVCAAIDMDQEILKMAALYHDIGKMWAPQLFTENQGKENIHDELDPFISFQLISRHVSDTVTIMVNNGFPGEVIKVASQHHGNTIMQSIYEKALKENPEINEETFRYKTPRPDCLSSLILMLCDNVEAASRSVYLVQKMDVPPERFVSGIYNKLHLDGQFDEVEVRLGTLKKIQAALISDVASNFQKRVEYEENKKMDKE